MVFVSQSAAMAEGSASLHARLHSRSVERTEQTVGSRSQWASCHLPSS